jgi:hypothetical protein
MHRRYRPSRADSRAWARQESFAISYCWKFDKETVVSNPLLGQPATGLVPFGSFSGGPFDIVNNGNLNVHFEIPIVNKGAVQAGYQPKKRRIGLKAGFPTRGW